MLCALLILSACAHHKKIPPETPRTVYSADSCQDTLVYDYAPLFLTHNYGASYNRMGEPSARYDDRGTVTLQICVISPHFSNSGVGNFDGFVCGTFCSSHF